MDEGIPQNTQPQSLAFKGLCTYWFKTLQNKPMRSVKVRITIFFFNLMHGHDIPTLLEMFQGFPTAPRIESKSLILSPWSLCGPICLRLKGPLAPLHFAFFLPGNMILCSRLEPLHLFLLIRNSSHHHDHMPWGLCFLISQTEILPLCRPPCFKQSPQTPSFPQRISSLLELPYKVTYLLSVSGTGMQIFRSQYPVHCYTCQVLEKCLAHRKRSINIDWLTGCKWGWNEICSA